MGHFELNRRILFVGAHPDDETFGVGATLAKYASCGVQVYYACATRGEAGVVPPELMEFYNGDIGDIRWNELLCAARELNLTDVLYLGYRDSGMLGSSANLHPNALINAPIEDIASRIVGVIRDIKPQVVITFDPIGGYRHPDHIKLHKATVKAFFEAADSLVYSDKGPAFQADKLYFSIMPRKTMRLMIKILRFLGKDPRRMGQNQDIDLLSIAQEEFPIHARIKLDGKSLAAKQRAIKCHFTQVGMQRGITLRRLIDTLSKKYDYFMRAYPPPANNKIEDDLFEGIVFD